MKEQIFKWKMFSMMIFFHLIGIYGVQQFYNHFSWSLFRDILILYLICIHSITIGSHRLWSHRSFKARLPLRVLLMICTSIANEGTIYHWARDHIVHHKYSDKEADPHNINNGFWYAHIGWLFYTKHPKTIEAGKNINDQHLRDDSVVMFQKKHATWWMPLWWLVIPTLYGVYFRNLSIIDSFSIFGALRWIMCLHATWCVNSVAHTFGYRPYDPDSPTTEAWVTNIVAFGEGSHNWHHKYPHDYAASELDMLKSAQVFNPSKTFIDIMYYLGQAYDLKRFDYINKKWIKY